MKARRSILGLAASVVLLAAACSPTPAATTAPTTVATGTAVTATTAPTTAATATAAATQSAAATESLAASGSQAASASIVAPSESAGASGSPAASGPAASLPAASASAGTGGSPAPSASLGGAPATVRLQLQWVDQAQFGGYYAADRQGYFKDENLTVQLVPGGPDVVPQQVGSQANGPEFTISWVPKVLEAREAGSDLVDIAQIFQRSGTLSVAFKDAKITSPCDFKGKKVGAWGFGNEFEVTAAAKINCDLTANKDYTKVIQPFDMTLLLNKEIDVAEAMIYNEYAQVLEAKNPETGELYKPEDLTVINYNEQRSAMLQDAIFARQSWLSQPGNEDIAVRFLRASFRGWIYCRDHYEDCAQYALDAGTPLGAGHSRWMMNEVNGLVWPSPLGIGRLDPIFWSQTVKIARQADIIKNDPGTEAYRTDLAERAVAGLTDDLKGESFQKATVEVTEGGQ